MLQRFRDHLTETGLISNGDFILIGYSGGADSTCLVSLCREAGFDVAAGHLHHGQRAEADKELALCEAWCKELDIPFISGRADVPLMAAEMKIGLEEAGRNARYNFLQNAAFRLQANKIATAHTQDDQVETVLLNLTRGSGMHGLAGIPVERDNIIRPLLPFSREETRSYCRDKGLWFHDDPSNADINFSRARLRHRVIPELESINHQAKEAIVRMSEIVGEEDRFLNGAAAAGLEQSEVGLNGSLQFISADLELALDRTRITSLPAPLFKRAMLLAAKALGSNFDSNQISAIVQGLQEEEKGSVTGEGGGLALEWNSSTLHFRRLDGVAPFRYPVTFPGETLGEEFGWVITAIPSSAAGRVERASLQASLHRDKIAGQLYFRSMQPGDKMQPVGFEGHRKIADMMSDLKLTKAARQRLPIICDMVGPVWVPGVCLEARVATNASEGNVILLQFGPIRDGQKA